MGENENIVNLNYSKETKSDNILKGASNETENTTTKPEFSLDQAKYFVNNLEDKYTNIFGKTYTEPKKPYKELADEKMKQKASLLMDSIRLITDIASVAQGGNAWKRNDTTVAESQKRANQLEDAYKRELEKYREGGYNAALKYQNYKDNIMDALLKREITTKTKTKKQEPDKVVELKTTETGYKQEQKKDNSSSNRRSTGAIDNNGNLIMNVRNPKVGTDDTVVIIPKEKRADTIQSILQVIREDKDYMDYVVKEMQKLNLGDDISYAINGKKMSQDGYEALLSIIGGQMTKKMADKIKQKTGQAFEYNEYEWTPKHGNIKKEQGWSGVYEYTDRNNNIQTIDLKSDDEFSVRVNENGVWVRKTMKASELSNMLAEIDKEKSASDNVANMKHIYVEGKVESQPSSTTSTNGVSTTYNAQPRQVIRTETR